MMVVVMVLVMVVVKERRLGSDEGKAQGFGLCGLYEFFCGVLLDYSHDCLVPWSRVHDIQGWFVSQHQVRIVH